MSGFRGQWKSVIGPTDPCRQTRMIHGNKLLGVFRRRDVSAGTDRESVRTQSVTHPLGMRCSYPLRMDREELARPAGLEPATPGLEG